MGCLRVILPCGTWLGRVAGGRGRRWAIPFVWGLTGRGRSSFSGTVLGCGVWCRPGWPGSRLRRGVSFSPWLRRWRRGSPWRWVVGVLRCPVTLLWCGRVSCGWWGRGTCRGWPVGSQPLVGFTGSRSLPSRFSPLVGAVVQSVVQSGRGVAVGDASGADAFVRARAQQCGVSPRVFRPQRQHRVSYRPFQQSPVTGRFKPAPAPVSRLAGPRPAAALAQRSAAMVRAVQQSGGARAWSALSLRPARCIRVPVSAWCRPVPRCGALGALVLAPGPRSRLRLRWGCPWSSLPVGSALGRVAQSLGRHLGRHRSRGAVGLKARRFVPLQRAQVGVAYPQPWQS